METFFSPKQKCLTLISPLHSSLITSHSPLLILDQCLCQSHADRKDALTKITVLSKQVEKHSIRFLEAFHHSLICLLNYSNELSVTDSQNVGLSFPHYSTFHFNDRRNYIFLSSAICVLQTQILLHALVIHI